MHRITRILAIACLAIFLAACNSSSKTEHSPLSLVPADTPYLVANLAPLDKTTRTALLAAADRHKALQVQHLQHLGKALADEHLDHLAKLVHYTASYLDKHSWSAIVADSGIKPDGLFAFYGLGLSPVVRGQLQDAKKFQHWIGGFEGAYGRPFTKAKVGDVDYQYLDLGDSKLRLVVATHAGQYVVAILPATGDTRLRLALGMDQPKTSAQSAQLVKKLAKANGYEPYAVSQLNFAQLPALIAGGHDPMLATAFAKPLHTRSGKTTSLAQMLPASCRKELERIAARAPVVSAGYTRIKADDIVQQTDIQLAPDITTALNGMGATVPGLGGKPSDALLDASVSLPVAKLGQFWMDQARAITSTPFHCPALQPINKLATRLERVLPRLGMPPLHDLLGLRVVVDAYDQGAASPRDALHARVLIATRDASGLLALAKAMLPPLAQIQVTPDGKPAAIPESVRHQFNITQPVWIATNDQALAIGAGTGEGDKLTSMLNASKGDAGDLARAHIDGSVYTRWLTFARGHLADPGDDADADDLKGTLDALTKAMSHIAAVNVHTQVTPAGLRIQTEKRLK